MRGTYVLEVEYWSCASRETETEWHVTHDPDATIARLLIDMPPTDHSGYRCNLIGIKIHSAYAEASI